MLPRPRFKLPLWAAAGIVLAAYAARSVLRGMDFRLDWPADAFVAGLFLVVVAMVAYVRQVMAREDADEAARDETHESPPTP